MPLQELTNKLLATFHTRSKPLIVGIDGLGGSGKTTLAKNLASMLKEKCQVVVLHIDDHIVEREKRYGTGHEEWKEYYFFQWDVDMLAEELFKKISAHHSSLTLPFYESSTDQHVYKTIPVPTEGIVLVEGVFIQRQEWKNYYDFTIFIDSPSDVRVERVLQRDTYIGDKDAILAKYKRRYWVAEKYYLETEDPTKADWVIRDGSGFQ